MYLNQIKMNNKMNKFIELKKNENKMNEEKILIGVCRILLVKKYLNQVMLIN